MESRFFPETIRTPLSVRGYFTGPKNAPKASISTLSSLQSTVKEKTTKHPNELKIQEETKESPHVMSRIHY
jgi:hypothetical protein